jgi:hypothetical protein
VPESIRELEVIPRLRAAENLLRAACEGKFPLDEAANGAKKLIWRAQRWMEKETEQADVDA